MNNVNLLGNITHDPELQCTATGVKYTRITVATNYKDKANFIPVIAFKGLAEWICKYFKKGSRIAITGHLDTAGKEHNYRMDVIADSGYFAEKARNINCSVKQSAERNTTINEEEFTAVNDAELPF